MSNSPEHKSLKGFNSLKEYSLQFAKENKTNIKRMFFKYENNLLFLNIAWCSLKTFIQEK